MYNFNTVLYQFLESDITFMGRDQELKWFAFSLYPLSFFLYSPLKMSKGQLLVLTFFFGFLLLWTFCNIGHFEILGVLFLAFCFGAFWIHFQAEIIYFFYKHYLTPPPFKMRDLSFLSINQRTYIGLKYLKNWKTINFLLFQLHLE